ncbi:hypothetical protein [Prevotella sp. lc2012]|uniref:hypothetical protein n=1 Tax=Prevotella sp. lc2012 TaxID=1761886 RepID=UPI00089B5D6A|nr:hypothetical protein [Prevotella sp. lc2012]SEE00718.1 hypothetical protein SAMN04487828_0152 [Prevotella sp. lc2012]
MAQKLIKTQNKNPESAAIMTVIELVKARLNPFDMLSPHPAAYQKIINEHHHQFFMNK